MFQFVIENQEELEQIVKDMEEASEVNENDVILFTGNYNRKRKGLKV